MGATNHFETLCLNPLRGVPASAPATVYVALFLTNPGETGAAGTEVTGGSYARQVVAFSAPAESSAGVMSVSNQADIVFPMASAAWGTIRYAAIMDSLTAGNMLHYLQLPNAKEGLIDTTISFVTGELRIDAASLATAYWKTQCLNLLRAVSISAITTTYMALSTGDPGETGSTVSEVAASPYARQAIAWGTPAEAESGNMTMANTAAINFPQVSTIAWGAISHIGIMDAATGGNMLFRSPASPVATFIDGDRFTVTIGGLTAYAA